MKKYRKPLYTALVLCTGAFLVVILAFGKKQNGIPKFKEPKGAYAMSAEWLNTKAAIEGLLSKIDENPEDYKSMLQLTQAYIQESRITGDHAYYDKAALDLTDKILAIDAKNFEALCCKATVLLSQHHFTEALAVAKNAQQLNPHNAFIYGLLCDANVELGNYPEAVNMADKMVSIRPDIRSYARVSYLREIHGDLAGAISAMQLAVSAGYPGLEQTAWTRVMLGHLYEQTGNPDSAEFEYRTALKERADYPFALGGLGHVEKSRGHYKEAIAYYEKANALMMEFSFSDELTEIYFLTNQPEKAAATAKLVIEMLGPGEEEGDEGHGHYADKELAYSFLKTGDTENALKHALIEYERRPMNIEVCEMLAWVRYKRGEYAVAEKLMQTAMRTNSQNPVSLCRAGLVKIKCGKQQEGSALLQKAFDTNPYLEAGLKKEAQPHLCIK
jgi:tetratricopeptide (TPR) repeat protein